MHRCLSLVVVVLCSSAVLFGHGRHSESDSSLEKQFLVRVFAQNSAERTKVANVGVAIEGFFDESVTFIGSQKDVNEVKKLGFQMEVDALPDRRQWGGRGFPSGDEAFHDYAELNTALDKLVTDYPNLVTPVTIGKSIEQRDIRGVRISSNPVADSLPTTVYVGCHHAREHLSVEIPLMFAQYLAENYQANSRVQELLDNREVWIVPMLNPDGAEYDISTGTYLYWRKNRRRNDDGRYGVDLNRNYAKGWGGQGSSGATYSDTYRGKAPFSEPETQAVRDFVRARSKTTVLISFHTFSELILWPWGHTNDVISNTTDRQVFETMGKKMATWNGYRPMKSSGLYVASGDTTDWAYDELGIFAFTFELTPRSMFQGGFYPGAAAIEPTFKENIEPMLYLMEHAENPYGVLNERVSDPLGMLN